jgi:CubicO group peptidase (beta-lactamase class C family)
MVDVHRRDALRGLAAVAGLPAFAGRGVAAAAMAPPRAGLLNAEAVGELLKQHNVPGVSLAIADNGNLVAAYGYGMARPDRPVTAQTLFQAASLSKTANALAVLQLAAQRRIGLGDPVNAHLTSWKLPDNALTKQTPVTVRMLLSHTGGTTVHGFAGYMPGAPVPTLRQVLDGRPPANSAAIRVEWPPGRAYRYSGGGVTVLQQMVIDVTGESYPAALDRLVLHPLAMSESNFHQPPGAVDLPHIALAYGSNGSPYRGGFRVHPEFAAAGLWTTPGDLIRMVLAIIRSNNGERNAFIDRALARQMLTPVVADAGLGTFINAKGIFSHGGSNAGYRTLYLGEPKTGRGIAIMTNGDNGEAVYTEMRRRVVQAYGWG